MEDVTKNFVPRSTAAEKAERVQYVKILMDQDITRPVEIRAKLEEHFDKGFCEKTIFNYIKEAKKEIALENPLETQFTVSLHLNRYEKMYHDCKANEDNRGAIIALQAKEKLLGLHNPEIMLNIQNNHFNTGAKLDISKLPEEMIRALMSTLTGNQQLMLNPDSDSEDNNLFEDVTDFD